MDTNVSKHPKKQQNGALNFLKSGNFLKNLMPAYFNQTFVLTSHGFTLFPCLYPSHSGLESNMTMNNMKTHLQHKYKTNAALYDVNTKAKV